MEPSPNLLIARRVVAAALDQLAYSIPRTENQITYESSKAGDPIVRLRFYDEGYQIAEAVYDPVMAALGFLNRAEEFWQTRLPKDAPEHDEIVYASAVNMLVWMLSKMHLRMWIAMGDLADETWHDWAGRQCAFEEKQYRAQGVKFNYNISGTRTQFLQTQQKQIRELWEWTKGGSEREYDPPVEQKKQFALEYPTISKHWEDINRWCRREDRPNWREHAKVTPFEDTPDFLLDRLEDSDPESLSTLALEHAARRVGICKPRTTTAERDETTPGSGLSRSTLYRILGEGKKAISLNQNGD
jgi:hypothetical protein